MDAPCPLVLASRSPYRKTLLDRLGLDFDVHPADIDETPRSGEQPAELVERLSLEKARAVARTYPESAIFGLDQVAELAGESLGKPGSAAAAVEQIQRLSGRSIVFHSGLCLLFPGARPRLERIETEVVFRRLDSDEIRRYVDRDAPMDCAGAFRSETLGSTLVERITSDDPSALMGLPLIAAARMLREKGWQLP